MDGKSSFLERKGLARVFPLAPLPLDAPSSLLSDLQVAVCSPDFFSSWRRQLQLCSGRVDGLWDLQVPNTASLSDPLLSSLPGAVYLICCCPLPFPPFWLPAWAATSLCRNWTEICWNDYWLILNRSLDRVGGRVPNGHLFPWGNQVFICCQKMKSWPVKKQRKYPPASSIVKACCLLSLLVVSLWVINRLFYVIFCVM